MAKDKLITLDDFNVNALAEIQGKKDQQLKLVKENPFVEITDNATWEVAKKTRTLLRTGRTDLEKEKKSVLSKIKEVITEPVSKTYDSFIEISKPHEDKQQEEVKRYEDIKENERKERERIDNERKEKHRTSIDAFFVSTKQQIESLTFETAKTFEILRTVDNMVLSPEIFEEFQDLFEGKLEVLKMQLHEKRTMLQEREDIRVEQEKIAAAQAEQERVENIKKSIDVFFTRWSNGISQLTFGNISSFEKSFRCEYAEDLQEFQPLFTEKRAELQKQLEAKVQFLQDQEQLRIDREAIAKQKQENLIASRTNELISLGFDKNGFYKTSNFHICVIKDALLIEESEWINFISETKERIRIANIPVIVEEVVEVEIPSTEPETVSTEVEVVTTEPTVSEVDYEGNIPEPTKEELQELLTKWITESSKKQLLKLCRYLFLIKE
jgi:hypothetical protein